MSRSLISRFLQGVLFGLRDRLGHTRTEAIMISTHYSVLETDIQHLIRTLPGYTDREIYVGVHDLDSLSSTARNILDTSQVTLVEFHTRRFSNALRESQLVILKSRLHLHPYRFFSTDGSRDYIVFDHGLITKAYGRHSESNPPTSVFSGLKRKVIDWYSYSKIDVQSVSSEVERFFRSSAERRHPSYFREYGYPRYDRVDELQTGNGTPTLANKYQAILDNENTFNVLYAPTHKDEKYTTTLFPFDDFDPDRLRTFLANHDIRLFLRMHPSEEDHSQCQQLVDGETIYLAGREWSHSPIELMPFIDTLVTDYSSIYMDFLPFDRPIIFVEDQPERFEAIRGLAFDQERYFPGETVGSLESFEQQLDRIIETKTDSYGDERAFVRRVLLPPRERTTVENILEHLD